MLCHQKHESCYNQAACDKQHERRRRAPMDCLRQDTFSCSAEQWKTARVMPVRLSNIASLVQLLVPQLFVNGFQFFLQEEGKARSDSHYNGNLAKGGKGLHMYRNCQSLDHICGDKNLQRKNDDVAQLGAHQVESHTPRWVANCHGCWSSHRQCLQRQEGHIEKCHHTTDDKHQGAQDRDGSTGASQQAHNEALLVRLVGVSV
mmetsp:Transcript_51116/g.121454  ORF Transcript_51116/g.121454 Transcript_51116/m.121454 type:complete len:203 (-) Transcript_51116:377-985(-)